MLVDRWPEDAESKPQVFYTGNLWGAHSRVKSPFSLTLVRSR